MDLIRDTPLEVGFLFWPLRPPRVSMIVVVKATFALESGFCPLAPKQKPTTGEMFWDDDPERSIRYPGDFALLKPHGECVVTGHVRPLTEAPQERTVASFSIGAIKKRIEVYGDRVWSGNQATRPTPFHEMPLCWERAFGGAGVAANPRGRGAAPDERGVVRLPNLENDGKSVTRPQDRPAPAACFARGPDWQDRRSLTGTYDERWRAQRFPWLPEDFRFEWFNSAPTDQHIPAYWTGKEQISLRHLHPTMPQIDTRLPGLNARAFVELDAPAEGQRGAFQEIALALDTLTVDADEGEIYATWRGSYELAHDELKPDGLARLFVMHEDMSAEAARGAPVEACLTQMDAKIEADRLALEGMEGEPPPPMDSTDATLQDTDPEAQVADVRAAAAAAAAAATAQRTAEAAPDPLESLAKLKVDLAAAGYDVDALVAQAEADDAARPKEALGPATVDKLGEAFEAAGMEMPEDLKEEFQQLVEEQAARDAEVAGAKPQEPRDPTLRDRVVQSHASRLPITGDFTGVDLIDLDLRGLDARNAILMDATFRGCNLQGAKFDDANLTRADFLRANLQGASLRRADLTEAVLEAADFGGADLRNVVAERAEAAEIDLDGAKLNDADFTDADLTDASLRECVLDEAVFIGATLEGANLTAASLKETRFYSIKAKGMVLDQADASKLRVGRDSDLTGVSARGIKGVGSNWRYSTLTDMDFLGSGLEGSDFTGSRLDGARLSGSVMRRAVLLDASLENAKLEAADLYEANLSNTNLNATDLQRANLFRANFFKAFGVGALLDGANLDGTMWERK